MLVSGHSVTDEPRLWAMGCDRGIPIGRCPYRGQLYLDGVTDRREREHKPKPVQVGPL